jgi:NitT/TauT family transport system permease protein
MAMATSKRADQLLGPLVATTYSLPKTSLIALFILWFGIGDVTNMLTVALACLLPVIVSTYHGVKAVPAVIVWSARAMNTGASTMKWRILLPAAMPSILTGVRIALGFCFVVTISAEMIAAKVGIGKLIFFYGESGAYAYMFGGLLAVVLVAYALDRMLIALMHYLLRWHDSISERSAHG